jgi:segregation and condensation protein A
LTPPGEHPIDDSGFIVRLEEFNGPLDLLLHLIREQEIDIADIPIARVADQFLAVIHSLGLNQAADYLEMAARLIRIKIQMLLPRPLDDSDWDDPRAELVRRLLEYEQVREVVDWLVDQAAQHADRFPRGWTPEPAEAEPRPIVFDLGQLLTAVQGVLAGMPQPTWHRVVPRPLDVEGATRRIRALLAGRERATLLDCCGPEPTVADVISALLAVLELARQGEIRLVQDHPFGTVDVAREPADQAA